MRVKQERIFLSLSTADICAEIMPRTPAIPTCTDSLSPQDHQRRERLIDDLVRRTARAKLTAPAILFLEMHKPLAFLGAQFLWAAQPFLTLWLNHADVQETARLLEDPAGVEHLIARLSETKPLSSDS